MDKAFETGRSQAGFQSTKKLPNENEPRTGALPGETVVEAGTPVYIGGTFSVRAKNDIIITESSC